jgi:hypothetical protein
LVFLWCHAMLIERRVRTCIVRGRQRKVVAWMECDALAVGRFHKLFAGNASSLSACVGRVGVLIDLSSAHC